MQRGLNPRLSRDGRGVGQTWTWLTLLGGEVTGKTDKLATRIGRHN